MATRPKFVRMANYSCECHIFLKKALWRMRASLASPGKVGWRMSANVSSPANFPKWPFWRVLKFDKFAGEWLLLTFVPFSDFSICEFKRRSEDWISFSQKQAVSPILLCSLTKVSDVFCLFWLFSLLLIKLRNQREIRWI